jgi:hypothetical protein
MDDLFSLATTREFNLSPSQFRSLIHGFTLIRQSGLIQFTPPSNEQLVLLFVDGVAKNAYVVTPKARRKIQPFEWSSFVGKSEGTVRILTLPSEGMRIGKMFMECQQCRESFQLQTADLERRFNGWSASPKTIAVHMRWPEAEAAVVFPGKDAPVHTALFIKKGTTFTDATALSTIHSWEEKTCTVSYYTEQGELEAWQEYRLHLLFVQTLELILTRYNDLAGRSLVSALDNEINAEVYKNGWKINYAGNGVHDHQIFSSPEEATGAYRRLYNLCLAHIEVVIGEKLTLSIVQEIHERMDKDRLEILRMYPMFSPLEMTAPEVQVEDER